VQLVATLQKHEHVGAVLRSQNRKGIPFRHDVLPIISLEMMQWWRSGGNFATPMPTIAKPMGPALLAGIGIPRMGVANLAASSGDCRSIEQHLRSLSKMEAVENGHRLRTNWKG
jgi:hypothetical protein